MHDIADLERRIRVVESTLIVLSIAAIAAADRFLAPGSSLGFLYLVPMSYSALTHRRPVLVLLLAACVWLRQWDTPVESQSWARLAVDWTLVAVFVAVVVPLRRLGRARVLFFRTAPGAPLDLVGYVVPFDRKTWKYTLKSPDEIERFMSASLVEPAPTGEFVTLLACNGN